MSRCDAKRFKMEGEKMKNVKKLKIMALVAIFAMASLVASCQAAINNSANTQVQLQIRGPAQVWEHTSFQILVRTGENGTIPIPYAFVSVGWIPILFVTDANGALTLTSPWVNQDTRYTITVSKPGFITTTETITVKNLAIP